jgi:hypothetical protein
VNGKSRTRSTKVKMIDDDWKWREMTKRCKR